MHCSPYNVEFTEIYDLTLDYLAENSDIRFYEVRFWDRSSDDRLYIDGELYRTSEPIARALTMQFLWDYDGNRIKDLFIKSVWGSGIATFALDVIDLSTNELKNIYTAVNDSRISFDGSNVCVNDEIITYKDGEFGCEGLDEENRVML